jgi:hypothetical protein
MPLDLPNGVAANRHPRIAIPFNRNNFLFIKMLLNTYLPQRAIWFCNQTKKLQQYRTEKRCLVERIVSKWG